MHLSSGARLGPYEILSPLGAGGMGEVYRARDTRLGREVAIKVLPANRVSDPRRKARFAQEARAASALNHPNIVTIHDIAEADGIDFLVMELVQGRTLDQLIGRNGLPGGEVLRYALALAEALTKAHAAGIVHRDLKPGNIIISNDGVLKVLDFGLAKLAEREDGVEPGDPTETIEGTIVGTAAYMSPEQAEGKPVDARSDIFSFGCVLYEMVSGRRAFSGESQASTLAAVLREDPKPLSEVAAGVLPGLERITQRCLRKDPARRFQHIADVKVELEDIKEASDSAASRPVSVGVAPVSIPPMASAGRRHWAVWGAVALLVVAAAVAIAWLRLGSEPPAVALAPAPLVTDPGYVADPSFSPDGNQVAYVWSGERGDNFDIYVKLVGTQKPLRLTSDPAVDTSPSWSPDGRSIAFIRRSGQGIYVVSALGGGERKVADGTFTRSVAGTAKLSWSPDNKFLATSDSSGQNGGSSIETIRIEDGEKRQITTPPPTSGDFSPAISRDGRRLVFVRCARTAYICGLYLVDLTADYHAAGQPRLIGIEGGSISSPVWTADGRDIVYMFGPAGPPHHLLRIRAEAGARPQRLTFAGEGVSSPAVAAHGNRLAYEVDLSDSDLRAIAPGGTAHSVASSTRNEHSPQFSPDGQRIAFASDRTGVTEVWVCDRDGGNAMQLTRFGDRHSGTPRWSPDGRFIAFDSQTKEGWRILVTPSDSGQSRRLTSDTASEIIPSWSTDGKTIYFSSDRTGRFEIWKAPVAGGKATQVTKNGGYVAFESRDGRSLYYLKSNEALFGRPLDGGEEKELVARVAMRAFVVEDDGIYYVAGNTGQVRTAIEFYRFATGKSEPIANIEDRRVNLGLSVSPDRKTFLYCGYTRLGGQLMLVEGFK